MSRGPALALTLLIFTGTLPWPLLVQPAEACTGCDCPPPAPVDISYFHYDHLGSPLAISNGNGEAVEQIRYNPYGDVRARFDGEGNAIGPPSADDVRYEFTGYEAERNTGLMYANARFYDPLLGSFLSHDPAAQFWSPYSYVGWDPVNANDPTGEFVCGGTCIGLIVAAAVGFAASAINALANGASFGQAMLAGAIGAATAIIGYGLGTVLHTAATSFIQTALNASLSVAEEMASAVLFVSGLGQSVHSASEGNYSGLIGLGLGLAAGAVFSRGNTARGKQGGQPFDGGSAVDQPPSAEVLAERRNAAVEVAKTHSATGTVVVEKDVWVGKIGDDYRAFASYERFQASGRDLVAGRYFAGTPERQGFLGFGSRPAIPGRIEIYNGAALPATNLTLTLPRGTSLTQSFTGLQMARFVGAHEAAHSIGALTEGAANRQAIAWGYLP